MRKKILSVFTAMCIAVGFGINVKAENVSFSWIGNSYSGKENDDGMREFMLHDVSSVYVTETGKMYTNAFWSEGGSNFSEITDGKLTNVGGGSHGWGYEGGYAVTANSKYVYFGQSAVNKGKNDGNWPESGYVWFGVTRRLAEDITKGDSFDNMKNANGGSSGRCFLPIDNLPLYSGNGEKDGTVSGNDECVISGLAATDSKLFVSDRFYEKIKVYNAVTMEYEREWYCPDPGQLALDSYGNLWVVSPNEGQITCFSQDGDALRAISPPGNVKLWSLAATRDGRLLVPDRGRDERILIYDKLNTNSPRLSGYIGEKGGIFSGNGKNNGMVGNERFYQISGIGTDAENNIYVCNSGVYNPAESEAFGTAFIESYTASHELRWRMYGLEFLDSAVAEPDNPTDIYTKSERFTMDYSKPAGEEWSYTGYTVNPHKYPEDFRITDNSIHPIAVRNVNGTKMMFATDMYGYSLFAYRFSPETDGETAIPCMAIYDDTKARSVKLMYDTTGDGKLDTEKVLYSSGTKYIHVWIGWDIDSGGNIYNARNADRKIMQFPYKGLNANGVPQWEYNEELKFDVPELFNGKNTDGFNEKKYSDLRMSRYDAENDVMYLTGAFDDYNYNNGIGNIPMTIQSKSPGDTLARVENWSKGNREPAYIIKLKYSKKLYQNKYLNLTSGLAVCGDYIFVGESAFTEVGAIHIYEAQTGEWVQDIPYDGCFGETGLMDIVMPLSAVKLTPKKYMLMLEDDLCSKILTVYWQPTEELAVSDAEFEKNASDGGIDAKITIEKLHGANLSANAYFTLYDSGRLKKIKKVRKGNDELLKNTPVDISEHFEPLTSGQELRVMVWDDYNIPLKNVQEYR